MRYQSPYPEHRPPSALSQHGHMRRAARWVPAGLLSVVVAAVVAFAPPVSAADDSTIDALVHQRLHNPRIGSDVGMILVDGATGAVVSAQDPDKLMLPASNMKIVTAVTALSTLGPNGQFATRVYAGPTTNEVVIQGGGDPLLTTGDLQTMAKKSAKQLDVSAPVVVHVDGDLFPQTARAPGWTKGYIPSVAASVSALARLSDYSVNPATNAANVFVRKLQDLGFSATVAGPVDADPAWALLAQTSSSVAESVSVMLSHSENNVAEVLFRQVAVASGLAPNWRGGGLAAQRALAALGIDASGMSLLDGSGLSRKDRVTPRFLATVLRMARVTNPQPFATMFDPDAMPVAGKSGTLVTAYGRYVTKHSICARGAVHAKTGTLYDTIALSGVIDTTPSVRLFSILVNDRPQRYSALSTRQALDGLTATMLGCWT